MLDPREPQHDRPSLLVTLLTTVNFYPLRHNLLVFVLKVFVEMYPPDSELKKRGKSDR